MPVNSYKDLTVWQKSIELVKAVYFITKSLPKSELFGLISQMQRAAVAIPSNIAEGFGRKHRKEFSHFLSIAFGSALELETQLAIVERQYPAVNVSRANSLLTEIQKNAEIAKIKSWQR